MRVHLTKRGPVWHCYYRAKGRRVRKSLGVANRKVAEQLRHELELRLIGGDEADADLVEIAAYKEEYRAFSKSRKRPKSHKIDMARLDDFLDSVDAVFLEDLTTADASRYLAEKALKGASPTTTRPRHIITDQGGQFIGDEFAAWCKGRGVKPRKGAVGKQGSIAIVKRLIHSVKSECTRRIRVPLGHETMRREIALYVAWYNEHRPHQALGGMTPAERYDGDRSHSRGVRVEPRPRWPVEDAAVRVKRVDLVLKFLEGRSHLPIVDLKQAA